MGRDIRKGEDISNISDQLHVQGDRAMREKEMCHFFLSHPDSAYKISFPTWEFEILGEIDEQNLNYPHLEECKIERVWDTARRLERSGILSTNMKDVFHLDDKESAAEIVAIHESEAY